MYYLKCFIADNQDNYREEKYNSHTQKESNNGHCKMYWAKALDWSIVVVDLNISSE